MDQSVYELGREQYRVATGYSDMERDADGFVILKPTASHADARKAELTTNIDDLESKLKQFREEKAKITKYQKSDDYKESKKKGRSKKEKKARATLLSMVFNNADAMAEEEDDEDEENYRDGRKSPKKETTLDTTYGKRFSPVVSMLHDTISDFDSIAKNIEDEINSNRGSARNMYRSQQIANLISAKNSKLSAVRELGSIAKTVSDLEYKKEKDKKATDGDSTRIISSLGAKYLRGDLDYMDEKRKGKKGKKGKDKGSSSFKKATHGLKKDEDDEDDEDDDIGTVERLDKRDEKPSKKSKHDADKDEDIAKAFAEEIMSRKDEFSFTPHERSIRVEGKYTFVVSCDPLDPEHSWNFIAVDPKNGKPIKGFRDKYKDLYPKKKNARMRFDLGKKKCTDLNTSKTYKLVFSE